MHPLPGGMSSPHWSTIGITLQTQTGDCQISNYADKHAVLQKLHRLCNHVKFILAYRSILHIQPAMGERLSFTSPLEAENYLNATQPLDMEQGNPFFPHEPLQKDSLGL